MCKYQLWIPVSVKTPDKKTLGKISLKNAESWAGLQFLLPGRMAKAHVKGVFFTETGR